MSGHRSYFNLGLGACLAVSLTAVAAEGPTVHVYNWYDYIGPDTLQDFKRDTGIQPVYDTFDSAVAPPQRSMPSESARRTRASLNGAFLVLKATTMRKS